MVREKNPDVLVLDLSLAGENFDPVTTVRNLTQSNPTLHILILTGFNDPLLMHALIEAGALGYILKNDDLSMQLPNAVKAVYSGRPFYSAQVVQRLNTLANSLKLTGQELSAVRLLAEGLTNDDIASAMKVSEKRVRNILTSLYAKLEVSGDKNINLRVASVHKARELGLLNRTLIPD